MRLGLICLVAALVFVPALSAFVKDGLLTQPSNYSAEETLQRLESEISSRGFRIFGKLDHASAAKNVELEMPFSTVLVFGNPELGTPAFILKPKLAIDLPLKALVWEDANGKVWVSYNSSEYLFQTIYKNRHGAPINEQAQTNVEKGIAAIVSAAVQLRGSWALHHLARLAIPFQGLIRRAKRIKSSMRPDRALQLKILDALFNFG